MFNNLMSIKNQDDAHVSSVPIPVKCIDTFPVTENSVWIIKAKSNSIIITI